MKHIMVLVLMLVLHWPLHDHIYIPSQHSSSIAPIIQEKITYSMISNPDGSFGYVIFINGTMTIKQEWVPAIQGIHGFNNKTDAEKMAVLMVNKIINGDMPPAITLEEIDSLNITL